MAYHNHAGCLHPEFSNTHTRHVLRTLTHAHTHSTWELLYVRLRSVGYWSQHTHAQEQTYCHLAPDKLISPVRMGWKWKLRQETSFQRRGRQEKLLFHLLFTPTGWLSLISRICSFSIQQITTKNCRHRFFHLWFNLNLWRRVTNFVVISPELCKCLLLIFYKLSDCSLLVTLMPVNLISKRWFAEICSTLIETSRKQTFFRWLLTKTVAIISSFLERKSIVVIKNVCFYNLCDFSVKYQDASPSSKYVQWCKAAIFLHLPNGYGHPELAGEDATIEWYL